LETLPNKEETAETTSFLQVSGLTAEFPDDKGGFLVLDQLSFFIHPQKFVCVLGLSGSGKSTLLRILGGLLPPTSGTVLFDGSPVSGPSRRVGLVFQEPNLMPWRTVLENITLPLEIKNIPKADADEQALKLVKLVNLDGFENWMPQDLSGGMAQRVAIARALIYDPDVLLLDEPFGALDALTRERMAMELMRIWQLSRKTVIMVTHSISEAIMLADRILVLTPRPGRISLDVSVDLPRPRHDEVRYTSRFIALAQQLRGAITDSD